MNLVVNNNLIQLLAIYLNVKIDYFQICLSSPLKESTTTTFV